MTTPALEVTLGDPALAARIDAAGTDLLIVAPAWPVPPITAVSSLTCGRVDTLLVRGETSAAAMHDTLSRLGLDLSVASWVVDVANAFAALLPAIAVAVRVEVTDDVKCPKLHVDSVHLRLVATLHGEGTEYVWRSTPNVVERVASGACALFKGSLHPTHQDTVRHRSPPLADGARRVVLVVDAARASHEDEHH